MPLDLIDKRWAVGWAMGFTLRSPPLLSLFPDFCLFERLAFHVMP